jgi:hypothetical protein
MSFGEKRGETQMKLSTVMRWGGPVAIVSGVFTMFADLLGLTIYVPGLGEAANTGYQAVGAGVILIALMLLIVGMAGLYAGQPKPGDPRVIEIGTLCPKARKPGKGSRPRKRRYALPWSAPLCAPAASTGPPPFLSPLSGDTEEPDAGETPLTTPPASRSRVAARPLCRPRRRCSRPV